jgi:5-oxoprolinase (ATP-hydrolysing)
VAELLGIARIVVPRDAGLLSALGLGAAVVERFAQRQVLQPLERVRGQLPSWLGELAEEALAAVGAEGVPPADARIRRRLLYLRFTGQEEALAVEPRDGESPEDAFATAYREIYGYAPEGRAIELESIRVVASSVPEEPPLEDLPEEAREAVPLATRRAWTGGGWADVLVFDRAALRPGDVFRGPALVFESHSATRIGEGWQGRLDGAGNLVLTAAGS